MLDYIIIFIATLIFYLPFLVNPGIIMNRGNDLTEFFWPISYFVKQQILINHQLPFWNNLFFSGTPLLPDPQSPIFYIPNALFLVFKNIDIGFLVSFLSHSFFGAAGFFLLCKHGFKFSRQTSFFGAVLYLVQPKFSGFLEAGHVGLIYGWAWLPYAFLAVILLSKKSDFKRAVFFAVTLSLLFYTHVLIFALMLLITIPLIFTNWKYYLLALVMCFGLIAIALLPQLDWQAQTTRFLLLQGPDIYPKWISIKEFLQAVISPLIFGKDFIWGLDTEKIIALGILPSIFAVAGFMKLKHRHKLWAVLITIIVIVISLNNISPISDVLVKIPFFVLLRVVTRVWFLIIFLFLYLVLLGFEKIRLHKNLKLIMAVCVICELCLTSWTRILKPVQLNTNLAPQSVYEFLASDHDRFRVFCLNRCLSQKTSATYELELADGYGTLQQTNYYQYSQQLAQAFWRNRYSLSIPPFELFNYEKFQPYSPALSAFNVKYVISDHILSDKNLRIVKKIDKFMIYENEINLPRANYPIEIYTPNLIRVDTSEYKEDHIILSEVYNKDWQAYANGKEKLNIIESSDKIREVAINPKTKYVDFVFEPRSFRVGFFITVFTSLIVLEILFFVK